jgi:glutathione S-transferase
MIQLYQAEWCPFSSIVRERLTELGVDYVVKQVAPFPPDRDALKEATGVDSIPVVVFDDGTVVGGDTREILEALDERFTAWEWESGHQEQHARH